MAVTWEELIASLETTSECQGWIKALRDGRYHWNLTRFGRAQYVKALRQRLREVQRGKVVEQATIC